MLVIIGALTVIICVFGGYSVVGGGHLAVLWQPSEFIIIGGAALGSLLIGTPIKVLATAYSAARNKTYPQVYVVEHPKTRIAAITLGHDGVAHSHPAYQRLLKNAVLWTAREDPAGAK